jgi:hypothetical protein
MRATVLLPAENQQGVLRKIHARTHKGEQHLVPEGGNDPSQHNNWCRADTSEYTPKDVRNNVFHDLAD